MTSPPTNYQDPPNLLIEPLVSFVEKKTAAADETFSLREEAIVAKHTITYFKPLIEKHILRINKLLSLSNRTEKQQNALMVLQENLIKIGEQLNDALKKVALVVKTATEIEEIKSTRIDSAQLLFVIRQIPRIIGGILETTIEMVCNEIENLIAEKVDDKTYLDLVKSCPYFGRARKLEIARITSRTLDDINMRLEAISVFERAGGPGTSVGGHSEHSGHSGVTEDLVKGMLTTVPNGENSGEPSGENSNATGD